MTLSHAITCRTPGYCWYNNDTATSIRTYGALYNWYAVNTAKLAPAGWHVPTDVEWGTLESYVNANLGLSSSVAKALAAKTNWANSTTTLGVPGNNLTMNNSTGFTALPGGYRFNYGVFYYVGFNGNWWSSTASGISNAWYMNLHYGGIGLGWFDNPKSYGFSVRCVMDKFS